jgi:hypothetical protein
MKSTPPSLPIASSSPADEIAARVMAMAPVPLLMGEAESDYAKITGRIVQASRPRDALEEFLLRDVIDLSWEILRLRRVKAGMLRASMGAGVDLVLRAIGYPYLQRDTLSQKWAAGDADARKKVDALLAKAGRTIDEVTAETFESKIDVFERLDRMLASAEARRNNVLHEIDRHRETLGAAARNAIDEVEDVEFRDVETGELPKGPPIP